MFRELAKGIVSICTHISPKLGSKLIYFLKLKKRLNLKNPRHFNEKLMWLKLNNYNFNKQVWQCVDKYTVRDYCKKLGVSENNLTKLIGVYDNANDIDFSKLPNKFALKCTHGMGFNIICENKELLNQEEAKKKLNKWLNTKYGYSSAEVHYNHVKPKIICEEFIENEKDQFPIDYKVYCFHGEPKLILVCTERKTHFQTTFYDVDWNRVYLRESQSKKEISRPNSLDKMLEISKKVSKEFPFVRVDFYEYNNEAILGELTFTPGACLGEYTDEASLMLGSWINLEKVEKKFK